MPEVLVLTLTTFSQMFPKGLLFMVLPKLEVTSKTMTTFKNDGDETMLNPVTEE